MGLSRAGTEMTVTRLLKAGLAPVNAGKGLDSETTQNCACFESVPGTRQQSSQEIHAAAIITNTVVLHSTTANLTVR